jgi:hypothetical protein
MGKGDAGDGRRYARFLVLLVVCAAGLVLVGWIPTRKLGGDAAVRALVIACLVSVTGSVVGSLPLVLGQWLGGSARATPVGVMASLAVRFTWVVVWAAAVALAGWAEPRLFLIWVGISYLVLLVPDVKYALARQGT